MAVASAGPYESLQLAPKALQHTHTHTHMHTHTHTRLTNTTTRTRHQDLEAAFQLVDIELVTDGKTV